jgi:hypothetical protein
MDTLSVGAVAIGPLLILGVILYTNVQANLENIRDNWVQYRCNPMYMPFAGSIQSEVSTLENFQYCTSMMSQQVFSLLIQPVFVMFGVVGDSLGGIGGDLNVFRNFISGITTFITSFVSAMFAKMQNTFGELIGLLGRIRDLTGRVLASAGYTLIIARTTVDFIISLWGMLMNLVKSIVLILFGISIVLSFVFPPLLVFAIFLGSQIGLSFCFHPDTKIYVDEKGLIPISEVKVGDKLRGCHVTAVMRCMAGNVKLYTYEGTVVSGEHLVLEDGIWKYVKDCEKAVPYVGPNPEYIYCLNTSNHRVPIGNTVFADYEEIEEPPNYEALDPMDTVRTPMGKTLLCMLHPGAWTMDGQVKAVVYLPNNKMQLFIGNLDGMFTVNGRQVRDYPDSHDPSELAKIQERVLAELNNKNVVA